MVATENGTRLTDMDLRHAVERVMEKRLWNSMRVAVEIGCTEPTLTKWLESPHETAMTVFRSKLVRFVQTFDAPVDLTIEEDAAREPDPLPVTASTTLTIDEDTGAVQLGELTPNPDCPLPFGFALLMPLQSGYTGYPAAIVVREKSVAITGALRAELGDATHVLIGVESRTDRPDGEARIAIAPIGSDHPWFRHAHKLTKSGDWGEGFRKNLGLPGDVYLAERQGNAQLWICTRRQWATEKTAA